jgi:hypothetical protein
MNRGQLLRLVTKEIGKRQLVWFGTRGDDLESVTDVPQFEAGFSLISAYRRRASVQALALEDVVGRRVDLDTYDIDDDLRSEAVGELRAALLRTLSKPSAIFTYRPTTFLSAVAFARQDRCRYLGLFKGHQAAFEHKPWLESSISALGVPHIPWSYISDMDQLDALRILDEGPVMLRRSRTTGGVGLVKVEAQEDLLALWPDEEEAYVSVSPYIDGAVPVNVGAVVWTDGVTLHHASVQLIGIPGCTNRPFGYCGNDFGAVGALGAEILDAMEVVVAILAAWLHRLGYRGAFGADFLVKDGILLFTEVNPRFQGSTHASAQLSVEDDESCLLLEHLAALLGISAPRSRRLRDLVPADAGFAHLVVHHTGLEPASLDAGPVAAAARVLPGFCRADVLTQPHLTTDSGGTIARITARSSMTGDGFHLLEPWRSAVDQGLAECGAGVPVSTSPLRRSASRRST